VSSLFHENQTIAAIATAPSSAAIGIVRVSGMNAKGICQRIFRPKRPLTQGQGDFELQSHRVYYGWVYFPGVEPVVIDEAIVFFMKAPHSYTREDVLEIQCHGGPAVTRRVLEAVLACGARQAEPGEFTKRAFLNGRIDLAQAEAVMELVSAATELQRQAAISSLHGHMSHAIQAIKASALEALATVEAELDFPEDGLELRAGELVKRSLCERLIPQIQALILFHETRHLVRNGVRVVLVGRPNTGKSSLFNAILGTSRVLVSPIPGTTRDSIEENVDINGLLVTLVDTAGIRQEASDVLESMGMDISQRELKRANHVLVLIDSSQPLTSEDLHLLGTLSGGCPVTVVFNKMDLLASAFPPKDQQIAELTARIQEILLKQGVSVAFLPISAKTGDGVTAVKQRILDAALFNKMQDAQLPIPTLRQKDLLVKALNAFEAAHMLLNKGYGLEVVAIELRNGIALLNEILGLDLNEDVLDLIFSRFCIGK